MDFTIAIHSGSGAPADAIERLAEQLGPAREETHFSRSGETIVARWGEDAPVSMASDERAEIGRRAILELVEEACERAPVLSLEWYAVSPRRN